MSDSNKRKMYDMGYDTNAQDFSGATQSTGQTPPTHPDDADESIFDMLNELFGGSRPRRKDVQRHREITISSSLSNDVEMEIEFMEAITGITKYLSFDGGEPCRSCNGSGRQQNGGGARCPQCRGHKTVTLAQGPIRFSAPCPYCNGSGKISQPSCE